MTLTDRGDNDLEEVIYRLKKRNKELENDNLNLAKEVARLNERVQLLEMEKRK
tara:strand:+ start:37 stop:195 length:159 start_codon:yes stop_codon:yes gene_type:complete